jgi:hypothetical protein
MSFFFRKLCYDITSLNKVVATKSGLSYLQNIQFYDVADNSRASCSKYKLSSPVPQTPAPRNLEAYFNSSSTLNNFCLTAVVDPL